MSDKGLLTERQLLELAADAAGLIHWEENGWNPLEDDGDALRLAVKLHLTVQQGASVYVYADPDFCDPDFSGLEVCESLHKDPYAATRRAIVRAAAKIGANEK